MKAEWDHSIDGHCLIIKVRSGSEQQVKIHKAAQGIGDGTSPSRLLGLPSSRHHPRNSKLENTNVEFKIHFGSFL